MEIISLTHHCLLFRFNKHKYLLGLTSTLAQDPASARLKPDHVILPSFPYDASQSLFLWHLPALTSVNCHSLLVADLSVKKRLEVLLPTVAELAGVAYKWELLKQHELVEEQLAKVYEEYRSKNIPKAMRMQPNGLAFNDTPGKLNIIVPESGRSFLLVHEGEVTVVDPGENILGMLYYYGIPSSALRTVILTNAACLNLFELLIQHSQITLITTQQVYADLKNGIKAYFHWDDQMLKLRLRGNIMTHQQKSYKYGCLELSFAENKSQVIEHIDIVFGMKRIRICPQPLLRYPSELMEMKDLELLVVYKMEDPLKKELECAPSAYRKRVLFNRPTRKYNNKYFLTIADKNDFISIQAHPYAQMGQLHALSFMFRHRDHSYRLAHKRLAHGERFNAAERVVYLRQGYVKDEKGMLHAAPARVNGAKEIFGEGNALIMHESQRNVYFYEGAKLIEAPRLLQGEDLLKKVKDNSFVKTLKRHREEDQLFPSNSSILSEEQVEEGSEWHTLNNICSLRTFEGGSEVGRSMSLYIVVKGGLKYRNQETLAGRSMLIGNLRRFYSPAYEDGDEIEAVKDSWAIEIPIKDLHKNFFSKFPSRMYEIFTKPLIFE